MTSGEETNYHKTHISNNNSCDILRSEVPNLFCDILKKWHKETSFEARKAIIILFQAMCWKLPKLTEDKIENHFITFVMLYVILSNSLCPIHCI